MVEFRMPNFGIPDIDKKVKSVAKDPVKSGLEGMDDNLYQAYKTKIPAVIDRIAEVGMPAAGEQFRLITRRRFNAIEVLSYICENERIEHLSAAFYSINHNAGLLLLEMINSGKIASAEIMMSNLRNKAYREKEEVLKNLLSNHPRIKLWFCSSHAKIISCKTDQGNYYTIEGSGNHGENSRVEQYVIDNDKSIFDFTLRWMGEMKSYLASHRELEIC